MADDNVRTVRAAIVTAIFDKVRTVDDAGNPTGLVVDSVHDAADAIMEALRDEGLRLLAEEVIAEHSEPATGSIALRWESDLAYVGNFCVGSLHDIDRGFFFVWTDVVSEVLPLPWTTDPEVRAAVDAAVRARFAGGYAPEHHNDVLPLCSACHHAEHPR